MKKSTETRPIAWALLRHPIWWLSLGILVLNDHFLKGSGLIPDLLTGKISDFAGLVVAPVVLAAVLGLRSRRAFWLATIVALGGFASLQLSQPLANALVALGSSLGFAWRFWSDPTDIIGLIAPIALFPIMLSPKTRRSAPWSPALRLSVTFVGAFFCLASMPEDTYTPPPDGYFRDMGSCGDGKVDFEIGESCDDGNEVAGDGCTQCQFDYCSDGYLGEDEACDDGNIEAGDGCDPYCEIEASTCIDGEVIIWSCESPGVPCESVVCTESSADPRCPSSEGESLRLLLAMDGRYDPAQPPELSVELNGSECSNEGFVGSCAMSATACSQLTSHPSEGGSLLGWVATREEDTWLIQSESFELTDAIDELVAVFDLGLGTPINESTTGYGQFLDFRTYAGLGAAFLAAQDFSSTEADLVGVYDELGELLWRYRFGDLGGFAPAKVALSGDGQLSLMGSLEGEVDIAGEVLSSAEAQPALFRFSTEGAVLWAALPFSEESGEVINLHLLGRPEGALWILAELQDGDEWHQILVELDDEGAASQRWTLGAEESGAVQVHALLAGETGLPIVSWSRPESTQLHLSTWDDEGAESSLVDFELAVATSETSAFRLTLGAEQYLLSGPLGEEGEELVQAYDADGALLWERDASMSWCVADELYTEEGYILIGREARGGEPWASCKEILSGDTPVAWVVEAYSPAGALLWREAAGGIDAGYFPLQALAWNDTALTFFAARRGVQSEEEGSMRILSLVFASEED